MSARSSIYLTMPDGVRIAVDVHLPARRPGPFAAILHQTRYFRAVAVRSRAARFLEPSLDALRQTRRRFLEAGFAWVDVDVRGSGASGGSQPCPWSPDEIDDGARVVDWITAQPWSSGAVGATGISYAGTAAELLLTRHHPALKAIAPRFSLFDVFTDVMAPGGVPLRWFTQTWNDLNRSLDRDQYHQVLGLVARLVLQGIAAGSADPRLPRALTLTRRLDPHAAERLVARLGRHLGAGIRSVDDDARGESLAAALRDHLENHDVHAQAQLISHRDDLVPGTERFDARPEWSAVEGSPGRFSPHSHLKALKDSGAAIFSFSGWLDGAYQHSAVKRFLNVDNPGSRLILGHWEHGGRLNASPHGAARLSDFDHEGALIAFFDRHLRGGVGAPEPPVRYFTMGEERWKSAQTWPPPESRPQPLFLAPSRRLSPLDPSEDGADECALPVDHTTGACSRWRSYVGPHAFIGYPDRARQSRGLPAWSTAPLAHPVEITGHPVARLFLSAEAEDGDLFVYLDALRPDGSIIAISEGMLRLSHRALTTSPPPYRSPAPYRSFRRADAAPLARGEVAEVVVDLLPVSYRVEAGAAIRLTLAGADRDNFGEPRALGAIRILRGPAYPSRLDLPVVGAPPG